MSSISNPLLSIVVVSEGEMVPVGGLMPYAGVSGAPDGWLFCDGSAVSQSTYAALYSVIGLAYGNPGGGNFSLPDLRGKSVVGANHSGLPNGADGVNSVRTVAQSGGAETHTLTASEMPAHTHDYQRRNDSGAVHELNDGVVGVPDNGLTGNIATSSAGGGSSHNTMHPFQVCNFIIKY